MRRFLLKIIVIVLCILVPLIIADYAMSKNYQNRNYYPFTTMTDIVEGRLDSDLWVLGSSRAWVQYNPIILDSILDISSYNLGMNAQFLVPEILSYRIACEYNKKPKYILLDLMCNSLTTDTPPITRYFLMPYINKTEVRKAITGNSTFTSAYLYIPYYRFYVEKASDNYYKTEKDNYKGYSSHHANWNGIDIDVLDTFSYKQETKAIELLDSLLTELKKDSINIILIHSPFYYEGFKIIHNHEEMMEMFRNIAFKNNVPLLDYTNDPISYDTMNFYNNMHLNAHGADLFSAKLAHDLDSLGLIPARK